MRLRCNFGIFITEITFIFLLIIQMKTRKKVLRCILALILIAWIVCAWVFIHNENKIKQNSVYCGDKLRQELWEFLENVSMTDGFCTDWTCVYMWGVRYEWVDYSYSCKVYNKENVELNLEPVNEICEWDTCEIPGTPIEEGQTYTIMWPDNWFEEELQAWKLILRWEYEDHADVIFIDQEMWQNYVDPHKMIYWDLVSFKWEVEQIDWAAGTHYYNAVSIDTLEELFLNNNQIKEEPVVEEKNFDENSWKEIISENCEHFFDGCNHCKRIVDWELVCSDLTCEEYGKPECTDFILEDIQ